jgi:Tfp pilus assembly protein PilF
MGRDEEALECYEQALALRPRLPEGEFAAGFVLARVGKADEAATRYRRAIALCPDFAAAWLNLGNLLREQGRELQAEAALQRAAELKPDLISAWLSLALLEREQRRPDRARAYLHKALDLDRANAETLVAWCQFSIAQGDDEAAQDWLRKALAANPRHAEAVNMRGILLHNGRRFEIAIAAFAEAEALGSPAAASNRGNSLLELGRDAEALHTHEAAAERDPHSAGTRYNLALTRLRLGDWERGWQDYEARWRFREVHRSPRRFNVPRWRGEPVEPIQLGRPARILLHAEQGLGDTIQFCRYADLVAACGAGIILQVQQPVERLVRSLEAVKSGQAEVARLDQAVAGFDFECPLMSLPAVFHTTVDTVPWRGPYLGADPELVQRKLAEFPNTIAGPRIGIAWAGNPRYRADGQRSTHLESLVPLIELDQVNWISLQKGEASAQLDSLPAGFRILDGSSGDADLAETAALISTLDLVVTTDTSIAHLAGAMAKPVWILLPHLADWRWMQRVESSPWYPTARLFRQTSAGDWSELIARVLRVLRERSSSQKDAKNQMS